MDNDKKVALLQDAFHYALMACGGSSVQGRESTFVGSKPKDWKSKTWRHGVMPQSEKNAWAKQAKERMAEAGFPADEKETDGEVLAQLIVACGETLGVDPYDCSRLPGSDDEDELATLSDGDLQE